MNGLEQAFYIIGIIFMSLMLIMIALIVTSVIIIRGKINKIHDNIEQKAELLASVTGIATGASALKQAKRAFNKMKS